MRRCQRHRPPPSILQQHDDDDDDDDDYYCLDQSEFTRYNEPVSVSGIRSRIDHLDVTTHFRHQHITCRVAANAVSNVCVCVCVSPGK